jgi:hypothetical protein
MTTRVADLRRATLDDLAALFAGDDDKVRRAALAEVSRRDQADRARRARNAVAAEWYDCAHAQFVAAESATRGNLLNKRGRAAGLEPFTLWSGPASRAMAYASEELAEFWQSSPRFTVQAYRDQLAAARREESEARAREALADCSPVSQDVPMRSTDLPDAATLIAMVRADGPEVLDRFAPAIDELLDAGRAAGWLGIERGTVYQEVKRHRWPAHDDKFGQSSVWSRRTLVVHRAGMVGKGAPGQERAKRKPA